MSGLWPTFLRPVPKGPVQELLYRALQLISSPGTQRVTLFVQDFYTITSLRLYLESHTIGRGGWHPSSLSPHGLVYAWTEHGWRKTITLARPGYWMPSDVSSHHLALSHSILERGLSLRTPLSARVRSAIGFLPRPGSAVQRRITFSKASKTNLSLTSWPTALLYGLVYLLLLDLGYNSVLLTIDFIRSGIR